MPFKIESEKYFVKKYSKLVAKNPNIQKPIEKVIILLTENPKNPALGSHKVNSPKFGQCISSRITGDIRLIWRYKDITRLEIEILQLIDIGGHGEVY
jgi:mRNA-degrading endonuclease YafQ of YafQ-DinJ toxin-antitoxin module